VSGEFEGLFDLQRLNSGRHARLFQLNVWFGCFCYVLLIKIKIIFSNLKLITKYYYKKIIKIICPIFLKYLKDL
jgi:hypothetical protein